MENLSTVDWPMLSKNNVTKVTVEKKYKKCDECEFETNKTSICEKSFEIKKYLTAHKVKRNLGSDEHLKRALKSHISFNSMKVGSPKRIMTLKRKSPQSSPLSNRK